MSRTRHREQIRARECHGWQESALISAIAVVFAPCRKQTLIPSSTVRAHAGGQGRLRPRQEDLRKPRKQKGHQPLNAIDFHSS